MLCFYFILKTKIKKFRFCFLNSRFFVVIGSFPPVIVLIRRIVDHRHDLIGKPAVFNDASVPLMLMLPLFLPLFARFRFLGQSRQNSPSLL